MSFDDFDTCISNLDVLLKKLKTLPRDAHGLLVESRYTYAASLSFRAAFEDFERHITPDSNMSYVHDLLVDIAVSNDWNIERRQFNSYVEVVRLQDEVERLMERLYACEVS